MNEHFDRRLFISFPVIVPNDTRREVAAVLNVNVSHPVGDTSWDRLHHQAWLDSSMNAVSHFARFVFWSTSILFKSCSKMPGEKYLAEILSFVPFGESPDPPKQLPPHVV